MVKKGVLSPEIYHLISPSDPCYPVSYLGLFFTHLSPKGTPSKPQSNKKCYKYDLVLFSQLFLTLRPLLLAIRPLQRALRPLQPGHRPLQLAHRLLQLTLRPL